MNKKYIKYLIDPENGASFKLITFKLNGDEVIDGILRSTKNWYPIIGGIPRILIGELKEEMLQRKYDFYKKYKSKMDDDGCIQWGNALKKIPDLNKFIEHQKRTSESFSFEWKNIYQENDYEKRNFFHFLKPYVKEKDLRGLVTIDIGCGSGRFTKWAAKSGTKLSVGTDLGDTVEVAYEMTKGMENVFIVQADIYNMPFSGIFDIAYSIGVLHHLPQPKQGFLSLLTLLNKKGKMLVWVYNRKNNKRAIYFYEPIRAVTRRLSPRLLLGLCYIPALSVHLINLISKVIGWKDAPFSYYSNFPFNMKLNDSFDVLATPKSNYYFLNEIKEWFKDGKLENIRAYEHKEAGITCIGEK